MKTFFKSSTNTNLDSTAASNFNLNNYQFQQISAAANGVSLLNKTNSTLHFNNNNNNNASLITNTKNNNPNFNSNNSN